MLKLSATELGAIAEAVKRMLICRHSNQAGEIARRVHEKFQAEEKVHVDRQCKSTGLDPKMIWVLSNICTVLGT
jgi:hypothetical protein